jgi:hypothetical protein
VSEPEAFTPERFIEAAGWHEASRPFREAHEYTLRGRRSNGVEPPPPDWHDRMIEFIRANGEPGRFEGTGYVYFEHGDHTYWVSRAVYPPYHPIINRRRNDA